MGHVGDRFVAGEAEAALGVVEVPEERLEHGYRLSDV
jgi:hypothetical protein